MQCDRSLDFHPLKPWPAVWPAVAWRGYLLTGFSREYGEALDLGNVNLVEALKASYPELCLGEVARLLRALRAVSNETYLEFRDPLLAAYGMRWSDRFQQTCDLLLSTPREFQAWVDDKKLGARDLASLLALPNVVAFLPFLGALVRLPISKTEGVRALELGVELFLMGRELSDLLPSGENPSLYLRQLEKWRRPVAAAADASWSEDVARWPWPSHVQGAWQRFGDTTGLEIKIRATSPQDFSKQLERLQNIREVWSCKS